MAKLIEAQAARLTFRAYAENTANLRKLNGEKNKAAATHADAERRAINQGFDPKAYKLAQTILKMGDDDGAAFLGRLREYLKWEQGGDQLDMFATAAEAEIETPTADQVRTHRLTKITEEACEAALEGAPHDPTRYTPGSAEAAAHDQGWRIGNEERTRGAAAAVTTGPKKASTRKDRDLGPRALKAAGPAAGDVPEYQPPVH